MTPSGSDQLFNLDPPYELWKLDPNSHYERAVENLAARPFAMRALAGLHWNLQQFPLSYKKEVPGVESGRIALTDPFPHEGQMRRLRVGFTIDVPRKLVHLEALSWDDP